jgi:ankyrin repeat protein
MEDSDPRHEQLRAAIIDGDDALALSIAGGGVDVNGVAGGESKTHLHTASEYGRVAVATCLLELGADADKSTWYNYTPLGVAALEGHQEVLELLVEAGKAQLDEQDWNGDTALHAAAYRGHVEPSKYLVAHGCAISAKNNSGRTALGLATYNSSIPLVEFLTSAANLTATENYRGLLSLCGGISTPYFEKLLGFDLRYATILAARHARRIIDTPNDTTPIDLFLHRLSLLPSADNRAPTTESQVFRRVLSFVGTGFDSEAADVFVSARTRSRGSLKGVSLGTKRARDE